MTKNLITSKNATAFLSVEALFGTPVKLENWISDKAISFLVQSGPIYITLTFSHDSSSFEIFEVIRTSSRLARSSFQLGLIITIPSLGHRYTYLNGFISDFQNLEIGENPTRKKKVQLKFERMNFSGDNA